MSMSMTKKHGKWMYWPAACKVAKKVYMIAKQPKINYLQKSSNYLGKTKLPSKGGVLFCPSHCEPAKVCTYSNE